MCLIRYFYLIKGKRRLPLIYTCRWCLNTSDVSELNDMVKIQTLLHLNLITWLSGRLINAWNKAVIVNIKSINAGINATYANIKRLNVNINFSVWDVEVLNFCISNAEVNFWFLNSEVKIGYSD